MVQAAWAVDRDHFRPARGRLISAAQARTPGGKLASFNVGRRVIPGAFGPLDLLCRSQNVGRGSQRSGSSLKSTVDEAMLLLSSWPESACMRASQKGRGGKSW